MKRCARCDLEKPHSEFHRDKTKADGLQKWCKPCLLGQMAARRAANPDHVRRIERASRARDDRSRRHHLAKYGVTPERYASMLADQGGGCAICGGVNASGKSLCVDHDHRCCPGRGSCGTCVRGLLCVKCNSGIGSLGDDAERISAAADYVRRWTGQAALPLAA